MFLYALETEGMRIHCNSWIMYRAAFEKEIEGLPSNTRSVGDLPPELHCPLCKEVMKDAVLTSKCCFKSFCDKCKYFVIICNAFYNSNEINFLYLGNLVTFLPFVPRTS